MAPRKQKRQDDSSARPQQAAHAPIGEAIAIGAAAGGLVLGTMQAQGALPDSQDNFSNVLHNEFPGDERPVETAQAPAHDVAPLKGDAVASQPVADQSDSADVQAQTSIPSTLTETADSSLAENPSLLPVQDQLVSHLSEQMTATLVKVIGNAEPGLSPTELGQSIISDVVASAQEIVAKLDIGSLLAEAQNLGDTVIAQIDVPGIVAEALGATSGIADSVLVEVADLPASILGDTGLSLADLPSSLLGNDGTDGSGGLLSEIFYADGAGDGLDIPVLSEMASTVVSDVSDGVTGLLALSYIDLPDHQGGHGLNALSLL